MLNANDYILRTRDDYQAFRTAAGDSLNAKLNGCYNWLAQIPKWTWFNPLRGIRDEAIAKELIQTISALAWGKEIVIDVNKDGFMRLQGSIEDWTKK